MWIIYILIGLALIFLAVTIIRCLIGSHHLKMVSTFCCNVFGPKGSAKTLTFSKMATYYPKGYLSTTEFFHKGETIISVSDINLYPNTPLDILKGDFKKVNGGWNPKFEGSPVFLDDCGIYLPNYMDTQLKKLYPSLPVAYALWRHCYNAPIHINSQDPQRVWKPLREQQEMWIYCRGAKSFGPWLFVKATIYDKESSAIARMSPMRSFLFNKFNKAELNKFEAENGYIKDIMFCCLKKNHKFNSRYFLPRLYDIEQIERSLKDGVEKVRT